VHHVIVIGAGLAGLACAWHLQRAGRRSLVVEASDEVGGRVRTDRVDGFLLDRGFQVLLSAYPEAERVLDFDALGLKPFVPGALVRFRGRFHRVADPWRRPLEGVQAAFSPVGSLPDKLRVATLRARLATRTADDLFAEPEMTTVDALSAAGFSPAIVDRFFRPFMGGVFLERELKTSSRLFHFLFKMFASGHACLPAGGMGAIPAQMAAGLEPGTIRLNARVVRIEAGAVTLDTGERLEAEEIVVATDGSAAAELLGDGDAPAWNGVTCVYFGAQRPPVTEPILVLNGDGHGRVNNVCVPSVVAPAYAPEGQHLVSATVLGVHPRADGRLEHDVRDQLKSWFGPDVAGWRHLRTYAVANALPSQQPPALSPPERPVRRRPGLLVCGDHMDHASIQGALMSGRRAAEALLTGA